MKAAEKLRATLGGNIAESIETGQIGPNGSEQGQTGPNGSNPGRLAGVERLRGAIVVPLDRIVPDPNQPRKEFDPEAIGRLAGSLRDRGQVQPCRVRWDARLDRFVIVSGERRWRAAQLAGLATLQCVEHQGDMTPGEVLDQQLTENCLREDLGPVELAHAYRALMDARGWSQERLAKHLHVSQPTVSRTLAVLDLPEESRGAVAGGTLPLTRAIRGHREPRPKPAAFRLKVGPDAVTVRGPGASGPAGALMVLQQAVRELRSQVRSEAGAA